MNNLSTTVLATTVLGIETSCDETAVAVVRLAPGADRMPHVTQGIYSQIQEHQSFGGVVPELAARAHLERLEAVVADVFQHSGVLWSDIDAISATCGPGLIGGVIVGAMVGKAMAAASNIPFYAINHLEGHALSPRITADVPFPYVLLLASGGHTQLILVHGVGAYEILGATLDDAIGETFDKTARVLGLPYPGAPNLERRAALGDPKIFPLPSPLSRQPGCDFSFSGLKTAVAQAYHKLINPTDADINNLCASFQEAVAVCILTRLDNAFKTITARHLPVTHCVIAGGVAANAYLGQRMRDFCANKGVAFHTPAPDYCTDNAAMIAWACIERRQAGLPASPLTFTPRPRWPLGKDRP